MFVIDIKTGLEARAFFNERNIPLIQVVQNDDVINPPNRKWNTFQSGLLSLQLHPYRHFLLLHLQNLDHLPRALSFLLSWRRDRDGGRGSGFTTNHNIIMIIVDSDAAFSLFDVGDVRRHLAKKGKKRDIGKLCNPNCASFVIRWKRWKSFKKFGARDRLSWRRHRWKALYTERSLISIATCVLDPCVRDGHDTHTTSGSFLSSKEISNNKWPRWTRHFTFWGAAIFL